MSPYRLFKSRAIFLVIILILISAVFAYSKYNENPTSNVSSQTDFTDNMGGEAETEPFSLSIEALRAGNYSGSDLVIEEILASGSNYQRYIVSYFSEGLKIFALLTVPNGTPPEEGFPAIIFNHGYIPPTQYRTTERYIAYTDVFSRNGYILLRPDYRGHGDSQGSPSGAYGSNSYTIDVLNAVASVKKLKEVNPQKIGMWGHSMGGFITLRSMVVNKDIKAGVIWAGVVASYQDLFERWRRRNVPPTTPSTRGGSWRQTLSVQFGEPTQNPIFWNSLSANSFLKDISGPIQLHHGTADTSVPIEFSEKLSQQVKSAGKEVELYTYPGDDHNIASNFGIAAQRSVEFFDRYLK